MCLTLDVVGVPGYASTELSTNFGQGLRGSGSYRIDYATRCGLPRKDAEQNRMEGKKKPVGFVATNSFGTTQTVVSLSTVDKRRVLTAEWVVEEEQCVRATNRS